MAKARDLRKIAKKFEKKLKKIKVFLMDVDGIMTNAQIYYSGEEVGFNRAFNAYDGYGTKLLQEGGIKCGMVTGGDSVSVTKRAEYLKLDYLFIGKQDKREAFLAVMKDGYKAEEILYMGDELFDIPLLRKSGFSATVPHAVPEVLKCVDYVTERNGGEGAVREVADLVRYAQKIPVQVKEFEE